jgi:hypothetical protein
MAEIIMPSPFLENSLADLSTSVLYPINYETQQVITSGILKHF